MWEPFPDKRQGSERKICRVRNALPALARSEHALMKRCGIEPAL